MNEFLNTLTRAYQAGAIDAHDASHLMKQVRETGHRSELDQVLHAHIGDQSLDLPWFPPESEILHQNGGVSLLQLRDGSVWWRRGGECELMGIASLEGEPEERLHRMLGAVS